MGPLDGVAFCDASDVSPNEVDFRFDRRICRAGRACVTARRSDRCGWTSVIACRACKRSADDAGEGDPGTIFRTAGRGEPRHRGDFLMTARGYLCPPGTA